MSISVRSRTAKRKMSLVTFEVADQNSTMKFVLKQNGDEIKGDVSRVRDGQVQTARLVPSSKQAGARL